MTEILIIVEGGLVQNVISNTENVKVTIRDFDLEGAEITHICENKELCIEQECTFDVVEKITYAKEYSTDDIFPNTEETLNEL